MHRLLAGLALSCALLAAVDVGPADAASLQVSPVLVEVPAPGAAATINIKNLGGGTMTAQVRVYKWLQVDGREQLVETKDVVASPPLAKIKAGSDYVIRVVRRSKQPATVEEGYRLVLDEIPDGQTLKGSGVKFAMRYSIPVFFGSGQNSANELLRWSVASRGGETMVTATNPGARRVRIAQLQLRTAGGSKVSFGEGLVGYVLPGSSISWSTKKKLKGIQPGGKVAVSALTEHGVLQATGDIRAAQ